MKPVSSLSSPGRPVSVDTSSLSKYNIQQRHNISSRGIDSLKEFCDKDVQLIRQWCNTLNEQCQLADRPLTATVLETGQCLARRKECLHLNWCNEVGLPIRSAIIRHMDTNRGLTQQQYLKRKAVRDHLYAQYLTHLNRRKHVFLEDESPADYCGHRWRQQVDSTVRLPLSCSRRDPTNRHKRQRYEEEKLLLQLDTGIDNFDQQSVERINLLTRNPPPLKPLGRDDITSAQKWINMHYNHIDSPVRRSSREKILNLALRSQIDLSRPLSRQSQRMFSSESRAFDFNRMNFVHPMNNMKSSAIVDEIKHVD